MSSAPSDGTPTATVAAVVVCHNEEAQLGDCLDSLAFCDQIVVVLDKCTDRSKEIALAHGCTTVEGAWETWKGRREAGYQAVTCGWVLELDCDERVSDDLGPEIRQAIARHPDGHFRIPFHNHVGDRLIRHGWGGSWGTASKMALFSRGSKTWGDERVHPRIDFTTPLRGTLEGHIRHYIDRDLSDMIRRLDSYTTRRARDIRENGNGGSLSRNVRRLFTRFYHCYVRRKGYKEGAWGFAIALMAGLYPLISHLKATLEREE